MTRLPDPWSPARQAAIQRLTIVALVPAVGAAVLALVLPGTAGTAAGAVMVGVLVAAPVLRVAWLAVRWARRGDIRFTLVASGLLTVILAGSVIALLGG